MWHRKPDNKGGTGGSNSTNSIARSFMIRSKAGGGTGNNGAGKGGGTAIGTASAARRSRDPPQAMNLSAFLRSVIAGSKEDLTKTEEEGEVESEESADEELAESSEDDNLHDLLEDIAVERVCDMLERTQVSSEDDLDRGTVGSARGGAGSGASSRRKVRKTESVEIFLFPHPDEDGGSDDCGPDSPSGADGGWSISPSSSYASAPFGSTSAPPTPSVLPSLSLHRSSATLKRRVKGSTNKGCSSTQRGAGGGGRRGSAANRSGDEGSSSSTPTSSRQRLRETHRLLLRRSFSGKLPRKLSGDGLAYLTLIPHVRIAKIGACRHGKRSRSATKKETPETPRDHAEEVAIRKVKESASRRYLIPRVGRTQYFNLHVVLDLDETLVSARNGPILVRPYVGHLIQTLLDLRCEIILWTAGIPQYVVGIIAGLTMAVQGLSPAAAESDRPTWFHHLIQRNDKWYDEDSPCIKNLKLLGRPMDRLLIIENNPAAVQLQVSNALLVQDYVIENYNDRSLEVVSRIASRCARSIEPVSVSLAADPELLFVAFDLAAEHSADGKPIHPIEYGLKYSPPGTQQREHAGESPCSITEKE